jgi:hypothetical protein
MHRLLPVLIAALAAAACAATTSESVGSQPTTVIRTGNSGAHVSIGASGGASAHGIGAPRAEAWAALLRVYEELEIPPTTVETRNYRIGNQQFRVSRRLGGEPLAYYVECGLGAAGVPHANAARLTLSIVSTLHAVGDSTEVRSEVTGSGRLADASGNEQVRCTTTGHLENRIATMLREQLRR